MRLSHCSFIITLRGSVAVLSSLPFHCCWFSMRLFRGSGYLSAFPHLCPVPLLQPGVAFLFLLSSFFFVSLPLLRIASVNRRGCPSLHLCFHTVITAVCLGFVCPAALFFSCASSSISGSFLLGKILRLKFPIHIPCPFCCLSVFII